jgi:ABC-type multidrug transport system ATPase subunit
MDPSARRYLWHVIKYARDTGMTVVLTTHSMDECEALCTKLGIMVNGQFECFGNIQHLKEKYGKGYTLVLKCRAESDGSEISIQNNLLTVRNVTRFLAKNLPNAVLRGKHFLLRLKQRQVFKAESCFYS